MSELILNLGCGENKLDGCVNIDLISNDFVKPDLVLDIRHEELPYEDGIVDEVWMIHCLEHIEFFHWENIFKKIARVLRPNGIFLLAYPEFSECAKRFIANTGGQRHFWRNTLYGRQLFPSDYHVCPMYSPDIKELLETHKFYRVAFSPESEREPYNTILVGRRDPDFITREQVITKELRLVNTSGHAEQA
jgi:SAM-dependent methyltransferase